MRCPSTSLEQGYTLKRLVRKMWRAALLDPFRTISLLLFIILLFLASLNYTAFFGWLGAFLLTHPWASLAFALLLCIITSSSFRFSLGNLTKQLGLSRVRASGLEISFSDESRRLLEADVEQAVSQISAFRSKGQISIARHAESLGIVDEFNEAAANIFERHLGGRYGGMSPGGGVEARAVIHTRDFVFRDNLLQLVDYYPRGGGAGRTFSHRFGIIGRVWRSGVPAAAGDLTNPVCPSDDRDVSKDQLRDIQLEWGLTEDEALSFCERRSYCCVPVKKGSRNLGVLYLDTRKPNFGWHTGPGSKTVEEMMEELKACCADIISESSIPKSLVMLESRIRDSAPRLKGEL